MAVSKKSLPTASPVAKATKTKSDKTTESAPTSSTMKTARVVNTKF
jgi:hypothetical protein